MREDTSFTCIPKEKNYKEFMQSKSMRDKPLDDAVAQLLNKRHIDPLLVSTRHPIIKIFKKPVLEVYGISLPLLEIILLYSFFSLTHPKTVPA
jgi:hypothetical protein